MMGLWLVACRAPGIDAAIAASTEPSVVAFLEAFEGPDPVRLSPGPSSRLARQIAAGAPADVFLSADTAWADTVPSLERVELLANRIVPVGSDDGGCIAIADPEHVPAGRYAKVGLERAGRWDAVAERAVPLTTGPAAAWAVASGTCASGFVYATDALGAGLRAGAPLDVQATYPLLLLTEQGRPLYEALQSAEAHEVFLRHGFGTP